MNQIHPLAFVHPKAFIGEHNIIGPFCYIGSNVSIGDMNEFVAYVSIGMPAEKRGFFHSPGPVKIGHSNRVSEFVTIHAATIGTTKMGNRCLMLRGSHLSHDSELENDVTVSCTVMIGGETKIMQGANLGLGAVIHQRQVIGSWAMVGMGAVVTKKLNVFPGCIYAGNPAKFMKQNTVGLHRSRVSEDLIRAEIDRFRVIRGLSEAFCDFHFDAYNRQI